MSILVNLFVPVNLCVSTVPVQVGQLFQKTFIYVNMFVQKTLIPADQLVWVMFVKVEVMLVKVNQFVQVNQFVSLFVNPSK